MEHIHSNTQEASGTRETDRGSLDRPIAGRILPEAGAPDFRRRQSQSTRPRLSLRTKLLLLSSGVLCLGVCLAAASIIHNARHAIRAEGDSFALFAVDLIESVLMAPENRSITPQQIRPYVEIIDGLRHVSISVDAVEARPLGDPNAPAPEAQAVPAWFHWLLTARQTEFFRGVIDGGPTLGRIVVAADPTEEIQEVWDDVQPLMAVAAGLFVLTWLLLFEAIRRSLAPLSELLEAFERLERADFPVWVNEDVVSELHDIHSKFNWIASTLQATLEDNRALAAHMVDLREEERLTLARELHDELAPHLFGIKMQLASVLRSADVRASKELASRIGSVSGISADLERVVRRMLHRLRPSTLDDLGLRGALEDLVEAWRERNISVQCRLRVGEEMDTLDDTTRVTLYRAVQECLTNVTKHALFVRNVEISLDRVTGAGARASFVELTVRDDGRPQERTNRQGFGLLGMQERVRALGGAMTLENRLEQGFLVRIRLPFKLASTPN